MSNNMEIFISVRVNEDGQLVVRHGRVGHEGQTMIASRLQSRGFAASIILKQGEDGRELLRLLQSGRVTVNGDQLEELPDGES